MKKTPAYLAATAVSVVWGLSYIGAKKALAGGFDTFSLILVRFAAAAAAMLAVALLKGESLRLDRKDAVSVVLSAIAGITLYYFCELNGLKRVSGSVASLIIAAIPALELLAAVILYRTRPAGSMWAGVALSLAGVYLVVSSEQGSAALEGVLYMLGACLCWIVYLEITGRLMKRCSSLALTFWQSVTALVTLIPFAVRETIDWGSITAETWLWAALFLGVLSSGMGYLLNNYSVSVLTPQVNAFFLNLSPVATVIGGYLILGECITPVQVIGGAVILFSLLLVSRPAASTEEKGKSSK